MKISAILLLFALCGRPCVGLETAYMHVDVPEGWQCKLGQGVWVCSGNNPKDGVLVSAAVTANPEDSLDRIEREMRGGRRVAAVGVGGRSVSQVSGVRRWESNQVNWVEATVSDSYRVGWTALQRASVIGQKGLGGRLVVVVTYLLPSDSDSQINDSIHSSFDTLRPQTGFREMASQEGPGGMVPAQSVFDFLDSYIRTKKLLGDQPQAKSM